MRVSSRPLRCQMQNRPCDRQRGERQIQNNMFDPAVQQTFEKIDGKGVSNVIQSDGENEPSGGGMQFLLQSADGEKRDEVKPEKSDAEDNEGEGGWHRAEAAEPGDQPDMNEMRRGKGKAKFARVTL